MAVSAGQEAAFSSGTLGVTMDAFQLTILLILYAVLYIWLSWVIMTQWKAWANRKITFYDFLMRSIRCVLITLFASFLLI